MSKDEHAFPLVPIRGDGPTLHRRREYVEAQRRGYGFAAHGASPVSWWYHYRLPEGWAGEGTPARCISLLVEMFKVERRVAHTFKPTMHWAAQCRAGVSDV